MYNQHISIPILCCVLGHKELKVSTIIYIKEDIWIKKTVPFMSQEEGYKLNHFGGNLPAVASRKRIGSLLTSLPACPWSPFSLTCLDCMAD